MLQEDEDVDNPNKDEQLPEPIERMEHETDGQAGEETLQSDTAVELAGTASEKDQAKEVKLKYSQCLLYCQKCPFELFICGYLQNKEFLAAPSTELYAQLKRLCAERKMKEMFSSRIPVLPKEVLFSCYPIYSGLP